MSITIYQSEQQQNFLTFWEPIRAMVLNGVSKLTATSYGPSMDEFLSWWYESGETNPVVATTAYRNYLVEEKGYKPATVNKKLSAVRQLFKSAAVFGIGKEDWPFSFEVSLAIASVKNVKQLGELHGTRLTGKQMKKLLAAPDTSTVLGKRDRAILAFLMGSGLRRSELVNLTWGHLEQDGDIWKLVNLVGKHNRVRSPLVPQWVYNILMESSERGKDDEKIFVSYDRHGNARGSITAQSIYRIVLKYSKECGFNIAPHDLRRTAARYLRDKGADIEDLQHLLGHNETSTTDRYIGRTGDMERLEELWEGFEVDED